MIIANVKDSKVIVDSYMLTYIGCCVPSSCYTSRFFIFITFLGRILPDTLRSRATRP